jgi:hypothetical protein
VRRSWLFFPIVASAVAWVVRDYSLRAALVGFLLGLLGFALSVVVARARAWRRARWKQAIDAETDPEKLAVLLDRKGFVCSTAAARLVRLEEPEALAARLVALARERDPFRSWTALSLAAASREVPAAREAAVRAVLGALPGEPLAARIAAVLEDLAPDVAPIVGALASERRAAVRIELAKAIAVSPEGARVLVELVADEGVESPVREDALSWLEDSPRAVVAEACRSAVENARERPPTAQVLGALARVGDPSDAALAARFVAAPDFDVASSACAAVEEMVERGAPGDRALLEKALRDARSTLRAHHPERDNPLADELVAGVDRVLARLGGAA